MGRGAYLIILLLCLPTVLATEFYVTPSGSSSGSGSSSSPWDLQTALYGGNGAVRPGDTIWVRGGTYPGRYASTLSGTAASPIKVRAYPGERVTIDGSNTVTSTTSLASAAQWTTQTLKVTSVKGYHLGIPNRPLEIEISDGSNDERLRIVGVTAPDTLTVQRACGVATCAAWAAGSQVYAIGNSELILAGGQYTWFWGMELMITQQTHVYGFTSQWNPPWPDPSTGVQDACIGCKFINLVVHDSGANGIFSSASGQATEIYGNLIYYNGVDTITDRAHGHGIYAQNTLNGPTKTIEDNIIFRNFFLGIQIYGTGAAYLDNFNVVGNTFFETSQPGHNYPINQMLIGDAGVFNNFVFRDNMAYGRTAGGDIGYGGSISAPECRSPTITNNYLANYLGGTVLKVTCSTPTISGNTLWGTTQDFSAGSYPSNTYYSSRPTGTRVFVKPNKYEGGRANIIVYNWDNLNSVSVDVSGIGLAVGDAYEVRDVQNFFGTPILSGTYGGGSLSIPLTSTAVSQPKGTIYVSSMTHTAREFNAFVIVKTSGGTTTPPQPTNQAPVVNAGLDKSVTTASTSLSGSASDDGLPSGTLTYSWSRVSGPGTATFSNSAAASTTVTFSTTGTYVLRLSVSDGSLSSSDDITITYSATPINVTPTTGAIGQWKFDEGSGTTAADSAGAVGAGALINGPVWTTGQSGSALLFDNINDYVQVPDFPTPASFSISVWAKPTQIKLNDDAQMVGKAGQEYEFLIFSNNIGSGLDGRLRARIAGMGVTGKATNYWTTLNTWHHFVVTYDGATRLITLYEDGQQTATGTAAAAPTDTAFFMWIGGNPQYNSDFFPGALDDVRFYNKVLDATEVAALAGGTTPQPPTDTQAPTVSLTSPANGATVSGTVSIAATASDNSGVAGVQFLIDGTNVGSEDTAAPYTLNWDTTAAVSGTHTITARARDAAGNVNTASVTVTVSNTVVVAPSGAMNLSFSTFIGGSLFEHVRDVATDSSGNIYVVGGTMSSNFPVTTGAFQTTHNPGTPQSTATDKMDIFVMKFSPQGSLIWSTFVGGPNYERAYAVEVDSQGYVYVAGRAGLGAPILNAFQSQFVGGSEAAFYGNQDGYVFKMAPDGRSLVWASYFGAGDSGIIRDIALDSSANVYLGSARYLGQQAGTASYPTAVSSAFINTPLGDDDGVIAKVSSSGSLLWARYVGGSAAEDGNPSVRTDAAGNVYFTVGSSSTNAFTGASSFDSTNAGNSDIYLVKVSPTGSPLYGAYVGGSAMEITETHTLAVDAAGNAFVAATTCSTDFPTTAGAYDRTHNGNGGSGTGLSTNYPCDAFITKVSPDGSQLLASTYLGGRYGESAEGIALDSNGIVYVAGGTFSDNFPVSANTVQIMNRGSAEAFAAKLSNDLSTLVFSTYLGGAGGDVARAMHVDGNGNFFIGGEEGSSDFPMKNAWDSSYGGGSDGFLAAFSPATGTTTSPPNTTVPTPGDLNGDKVVNILDIVVVTNAFTVYNAKADLAAPFGVINLFDVMEVVKNWGKTY
jgi:hypothetical protein